MHGYRRVRQTLSRLSSNPDPKKPTVVDVVIADHQPVYRAGVAKLLAAEDDMRIVAQPSSVAQLSHAVEKLHPHVLILSSGFFPRLSDIRKIGGSPRKRPVAILILADNAENTARFVTFGVHGVFYRSVQGDMLIQGVRRLAEGGRYLQAHAADEVLFDQVGERVTSRLSHRELRIVAAIVQGFRNREIAQQMGITLPLIKRTIRNIFDKTGVSGRLELALFVIHHRVLAQAAAAEQSTRPTPLIAAADAARDALAVEKTFYPAPKPVLPPRTSPNPLAPSRNHPWYHPPAPKMW